MTQLEKNLEIAKKQCDEAIAVCLNAMQLVIDTHVETIDILETQVRRLKDEQ